MSHPVWSGWSAKIKETTIEFWYYNSYRTHAVLFYLRTEKKSESPKNTNLEEKTIDSVPFNVSIMYGGVGWNRIVTQ